MRLGLGQTVATWDHTDRSRKEQVPPRTLLEPCRFHVATPTGIIEQDSKGEMGVLGLGLPSRNLLSIEPRSQSVTEIHILESVYPLVFLMNPFPWMLGLFLFPGNIES